MFCPDNVTTGIMPESPTGLQSLPERYHIHTPTPHVPNSRLPVLIYRSVLRLLPLRKSRIIGGDDDDNSADKTPHTITTTTTTTTTTTAAAARALIESNHWRYGGTFKTYWRHHFHSVTHECYAVIAGQSKLLLGVGPLDHESGEEEVEKAEGTGTERRGVEVVVGEGDVIVLPAGVSHCSITSENDYEYLGLYPEADIKLAVFKGSPEFDNNFCKAGKDETRAKAETAAEVPIPKWDPIYGPKGPLSELWSNQCDCGDRQSSRH